MLGCQLNLEQAVRSNDPLAGCGTTSKKERNDESKSLSKTDLPEMQDRQAQRNRAHYLQKPTS
jgi:hypothetical protein